MNEQEQIIRQLDDLARQAVDRCLDDRGFVLYSGGVDSSVLAALVSKRVKPTQWSLFTLGVSGSQDINQSIGSGGAASSIFSLPLFVREVDEQKVIRALGEVKKFVTVNSMSHLEDCVAFYVICEEVKKQRTSGSKCLLLTANGPDELFCGYDRFRRIVDTRGYQEVEIEVNRALKTADSLRENVRKIAQYFGLKIAEPFFDNEFVNFCLQQVPSELKIETGNDILRKRIWRKYARYLGIPKEIAERPKKAMQYSMGIHKIVFSVTKNQGIGQGKSKALVNRDPLRKNA